MMLSLSNSFCKCLEIWCIIYLEELGPGNFMHLSDTFSDAFLAFRRNIFKLYHQAPSIL